MSIISLSSMSRGESPTPTELRSKMVSIEELHDQFQVAKVRAKDTGDWTEARTLRATLDARMQELRDQVNSFETRIEVRKQYTVQEKMLTVTGILETWESGEHAGKKGIIGIDRKRYPIPTYEDVFRHMVENREVLASKIEQGFTKLLLVPFGMPIDTLIEKYKGALQRNFNNEHLYHTRSNPADPLTEDDRIKALHRDGPLYVWDEYKGADVEVVDPVTKKKTSKMVYHPESLAGAREEDVKHNGKTKADLIQLNGGWNILLIEALPNIPRAGNTKTTGGRTQIDTTGNTIKKYIKTGETIPSAIEYHKALREEANNPDSPYHDERGLTPEEAMIIALTQLEETGEVIDDAYSGGHGSVGWLPEAYFPASEGVPFLCWGRGDRQARLSRIVRGNRYDNFGLRSAVGVKWKA